MIVDDEVAFCKVMQDFLKSKGFDVVVAYSGDEALAKYGKENPDLVLLDILMPGKDGMETFRELKAIDPNIKVIMVTAVHNEDVAKQAASEGALDYIIKPINAEYLELSIMSRLSLLDEKSEG